MGKISAYDLMAALGNLIEEKSRQIDGANVDEVKVIVIETQALIEAWNRLDEIIKEAKDE